MPAAAEKIEKIEEEDKGLPPISDDEQREFLYGYMMRRYAIVPIPDLHRQAKESLQKIRDRAKNDLELRTFLLEFVQANAAVNQQASTLINSGVTMWMEMRKVL